MPPPADLRPVSLPVQPARPTGLSRPGLSAGAGGAAVPRPVPGLLAAAERHLRIGAPADLA
ncbi:hypothetical protein DLJ59_02995, partial [Micromonospora inaquosa]